MTSEQVVLRFVEAINQADADGLADLMTDRHVFIDSDGSKMTGRESMRKAWSQYFSMMPGYRVNVEDIFCQGNKVVLVGLATGACATTGRLWSVPAAWRAVVERDRVAVWQVFVNPEPILAAMRDQAGGES